MGIDKLVAGLGVAGMVHTLARLPWFVVRDLDDDWKTIPMAAELVAIGTELINGANLDTNSRWLSQRLVEVGIPVAYHTKVGDDLEQLVRVLRLALRRADVVVCTGGLGPTLDDLTRQAFALLLGVPLQLHEDQLELIRAMFRLRGRTMNRSNEVQACFPEGATPIPNPNGTAPGIYQELGHQTLLALPGVPREMVPMVTDWVLPRLAPRHSAGRVIRHRSIHCFGTGESHIESLLGDLTSRGRHPEVGITASEATITLRIVAQANTITEAEQLLAKDAEYIRQRLGDLVFGEEEDELPQVIYRMLLERHQTLATAESCTGGLMGHQLTEIPGVSVVYLGGVISYSNEAKIQQLGVPAELIAAHGAVSPEVVEAMAAGARQRFQADYALAISGIAGPDGGTPEKPVGLVYVGLAHANGTAHSKYNWPSFRSSVKIRSVKTAFNLLRLHLLQQTIGAGTSLNLQDS